MNQLYFNLTQEEIDQLQGILQSDSEDDSIIDETKRNLSLVEAEGPTEHENNSDENDDNNELNWSQESEGKCNKELYSS